MSINIEQIIKDNGVVGAGGAGFPTHIKVNASAEYVLVNGAECEPLLRVDQQLMQTKTKEMLDSLKLVMDRVGAKKGIVCLKAKYKDAVKELDLLTKEYEGISVFQMDNFYPAGDEQIMVYEATGRIVPEGGMPLNVGIVVTNVETLININNAVVESKPVVDTYVTVTGEVKNPITVNVPIGMSVKEMIDLAGGTSLTDYCVIDGGPMMGKIIDDMSTPITKTTKGLIVLDKKHSLIMTMKKPLENMTKEAKTSCMNCSLCSEVCPRNLIGHSINPHKLMRISSYNSTCDNASPVTNAFLCCECRLCQYACVMDLQPWKLHNTLKNVMISNGVKNPHNNVPEKVNEFRPYKKYPVTKLVMQLELNKYDVKAPFINIDVDPIKVRVNLKQHIGAPATAVVKIGDTVSRFDLVAKIDDGKLGANVHASIGGSITNVTGNYIEIGKV